MTTHQTAKTKFAKAPTGVTYGYRHFGSDKGVPLLFLIHFRASMDWWDPLLINLLAATRPVILFDYVGVGQSTGTVASTMEENATHVIDFLKAINIQQVDILGFSIGGFVAPLVYLNGATGLVRKLVIAASSPSAGEGVIKHPPEQEKEVAELAGGPELTWENCFSKLFFLPTKTSQAAGRAWWQRIHERNVHTSGEERSKMVSEGYADQGAGVKAMKQAREAYRSIENRKTGTYDRLHTFQVPVFIAEGKDDFMLPTINSVLMQRKIPDARLKIFPDSGHGFLFQFTEEYVRDVVEFLDG